MKLGIAGLPDMGKSTLFDAITNAGAESTNYPFYITDPNVGVAAVPDRRLDALVEMYHPKKTTPAVVEFIDIAGLAKDASRDQGLGNKLLANIRGCDTIICVVRCFDDENIVHTATDTSTNVPVDPTEDIGVIDIELTMADVRVVEHHIDKTQKAVKGDKKYLREVEVFSALKDWLNDGNSARSFDCGEDDAAIAAIVELSPLKPIIYAIDLDKEGFADHHASAYYKVVERLAVKEGAQVIPVCVKLEAEIAELNGEEKKTSLDNLRIAELGPDRFVKASYILLDLTSFLTSGEDECCAWTIKRGTKVPQAADKAHTNFERGSIRAEMVNLDDLTTCSSINVAKEKGLARSEGKEYVMKDGDIVLFRFNVQSGTLSFMTPVSSG